MRRGGTFAAVIASSLAGVLVGGSIEDRLAEHDRRIESLESWRRASDAGSSPSKPADAQPADRPAFAAKIVRKWFSPTDFDRLIVQEYLRWDIELTPEGLERPAKSVKGVLEIADLFGEVKFRVNATWSGPFENGRVWRNDGVGIVYDQFESQHTWLRSTELSAMKTRFIVRGIVYDDDSVVQY